MNGLCERQYVHEIQKILNNEVTGPATSANNGIFILRYLWRLHYNYYYAMHLNNLVMLDINKHVHEDDNVMHLKEKVYIFIQLWKTRVQQWDL